MTTSGEMQKYKELYSKIYGSYIDVKSTENTVNNYTELAKDYETDFVGLGYETPSVIANTTLKMLGKDESNPVILDIACGTGLVAQSLRNSGFSGPIDGIDGSAGMLELAEHKKVYRVLKEAYILPDKETPFDSNAYDAVVCCGGFGPGHLHPMALADLVRVCKTGGVIVFATRDNTIASDYVTNLNAEIEKLVSNGMLKKEEVFQAPYFNYDFSIKKESVEPLLATIYCYRKN